MSTSNPYAMSEPARRPLRLWPAVVIVLLMWAVIKLPAQFSDNAMVKFMGMFLGAAGGALLFLLWWMFFSGARWRDRWLALTICGLIGVGAFFTYHRTIDFNGLLLFALPIVVTVWTAYLVITPALRWPVRFAGLVVALIAAWGYTSTLRFDGTYGDLDTQISYRWQPTDEDHARAERAQRPKTAPLPAEVPALVLSPGDWPEFRGGAQRDSKLTGVRIATDWTRNPPKKLWRQRVGPGWSSFAVIGNRLFTQEQLDGNEMVVCYDADTGKELWTHADTARFEEALAGPGPRATPTFHDGRIYTMGGAGRLNCLAAGTGKVFWSRDVLADSGAKLQMWGCASSPLVHHGIVSVFAGGPDGKAIMAYNADSGEIAWKSGTGKHTYGSLQLSKLNSVEQLLIATDSGLTAFEPATGRILWHDDWDTGGDIARISQPAVIGETDVIYGTAFEKGTRRLNVKLEGSTWKPTTVWEQLSFKPYYNDFVVHDGHIYGYNGPFLICFDLEDQKIKWKERGYGNGQILLLADQNLMLVITEKGELALVETNPKERKEIARMPAISGKTWNHPVIAHGRLYVRNGAEMACFELRQKNSEVAAK